MGSTAGPDRSKPAVLAASDLQALFDALRARGYRLIGPKVRDQAIVYDDIEAADELPKGWTDEQDGGRYRLIPRHDGALFGYAVGQHSWKAFLNPPIQRLWRARRADGDVTVTPEPLTEERLALIGVRACELAAIGIQDRVLMGGAYVDLQYQARRTRAFLVAINCSVAGGTCFCVSMETGPAAKSGYDLVLTELLDTKGHRFLVESGSDAGAEVLAELPLVAAGTDDIKTAAQVVEHTAASMGRQMRSDDLHDLLLANLEHPRWAEVADRCLSCSNCTMVCPTCFCTSVEDTSDLAGVESARSKRWDSCFTVDYSHVHGGSVRPNVRSRYRQWMTHKLATWVDQFGSSGCVGCGRCITWCPVGIDITEEVAAIRGSANEETGGAP
jgi:ferredoxin